MVTVAAAAVVMTVGVAAATGAAGRLRQWRWR